ncbi:uncharacterized protein LOC109540832 [Dendroctonus ponderosae]|uniref:MARVEL domain-containing protein n=1 Tax=Dendroctonus ponderosae TaxID=77166 RepID=A0AAR5PVC2_DENPD|nr:uncharacterized protein LOC109540832 [Dendroctonus ponderosae]XP_048517553.1 uncharacterized protein LOC109540832 [Dendroctonus ponderosae]KAH1019844.1 hypothetical protein HUJ04_009605 [Dendroctonus ponderosae]KAH1019845.1 hypothetical protein HUJ04_009605 [Dendroctonus ponderosae]KAH1026985.1 hypothetical protein HUJ05_000567 [Dendroctonus ponderosae]KAH1026986.1 hypothetical protein HUJ05_000567 [Dendroctonus ponderosae]
MNLLIGKLTVINTAMSGCRRQIQKLSRPWVLALIICVALWALLVISGLHSWADEHLASNRVVYRLFPVYVHLGGLLLVTVLVSGMSWYIFYKNDFDGCCSTMGFFFYILAEIILMVNALTMKLETEVKFYVESLALFVLLFVYTCAVSWEFSLYTERQRLRHEEYINRQITSRLINGGNCYRLPLKGPFKLPLDFKTPAVGKASLNPARPSSRR